MVQLLEDRAFEVEQHRLVDSPVEIDLSAYDGLVLGTPAFGLAHRGVGPTPLVEQWIKAQSSLDEVKVAVFCVYELRPGNTLRNIRHYVTEGGGEVVAAQAYSRLRRRADEHVLPAECMVRIR